ncbi:MAG TPA: methyltransferase domain-containing protein [Burkholderiales bacterium]|nr:methyltransferase domain-containing protein [Burkholderiales bacterium]
MAEINLLARYPKAKRNVQARLAHKEENRRIALRFGKEYFDGTREQGYGGYRYDGRWIPIAEDIVRHFGLKPGERVLDVGCGKGFLVKDLMKVCAGLDAYGLDVSEYAVLHCEPEVVGRLHVGNATKLPFPDKSFDAVLAINTVHNLDRAGCVDALKEIERVSRGRSYIQVDAYRTPQERKLFEDWMLTAQTYGTPDDWRAILREAGYRGDYYWTILEIDPE